MAPMDKAKQVLNEANSLLNSSLSKAFELILNQALKLDDDQGKAFNKVDEKVIQLTFSELKKTFFIIYQSPQATEEVGYFTVQTHLMGQADSHLKTTVLDWVKHKTTASDTDPIGQDFLNATQQIEIDWEEALSKITGDFMAFKIGSALKTGQQNLQVAKEEIGDTLSEYLLFEANLLPTESQVNRFNKQVESTANSVDKMAERIQKLTKNIEN